MKSAKQGRMISVLRTAAGSPAAVGMIKALRRRNIRVIGTDCNPLSAGFHFCDSSYVTPWGDDPQFISRLLAICDIEKPHAIISGPEEEVLTLSKNKRHFNKRDVVVLTPDYEAVAICADKLATDAFFRQTHVPTLTYYAVRFPAIKPRFGRGGTDVFKLEINVTVPTAASRQTHSQHSSRARSTLSTSCQICRLNPYPSCHEPDPRGIRDLDER